MQYINELIEKDIGKDVEKAKEVKRNVFADSIGLFASMTLMILGIVGMAMFVTMMDETAFNKMMYDDLKLIGTGFVCVIIGLGIGITVSNMGMYNVADYIVLDNRRFKRLIEKGYKEEDCKEDVDGRDNE